MHRRQEMPNCGGCGNEYETKPNLLKTEKTLVIQLELFDDIFKERFIDKGLLLKVISDLILVDGLDSYGIKLPAEYDYTIRKTEDTLILIPLKKEVICQK